MAWALGIPAALGLLLQQYQQQRNAEALQAAQLLRGQGTFEPMTPEQLPAQSGFQRFLGAPAPNTFKVGGTTFGFKPYPTQDIPGLGPVPITPQNAGDILKAVESMKGEQDWRETFGAAPPQMPFTAGASMPSVAPPALSTPGRATSSVAPQGRVSSSSMATAPGDLPMSLPPAVAKWWPIIQEAAIETRLDPRLIAAHLWQESAGDPNAISEAGAQGLMQIMPGTQAEAGVTKPFDPRQSIFGGARYLKSQLDRAGGDLTRGIIGYFSPAAAEAAGKTGKIPPGNPKTESYAQSVMRKYRALGGIPNEQLEAVPTEPSEGLAAVNTRIRDIDQQMAKMRQFGLRRPNMLPRVNSEMDNLRADKAQLLEERKRLLEPGQRAAIRRAELPAVLEQKRAESDLETEAQIERQDILGPRRTAETVRERTLTSDIMTDFDRSLPGFQGKMRYSQLSDEEKRQLHETKADLDMQKFAIRAQAQSEVMDARDRAKQHRTQNIDLTKTEQIIGEIENEFTRFHKASLLSDPVEKAKAGIALRTVAQGFSPQLARLGGERGMLTNQDREKAEALLPGVTTPESIGKEDIARLKRLIGGWKGINDSLFRPGTTGPATPTETPKNGLDLLPPAKDYSGVTIEDTLAKKKYRSDGTHWLEVP